MTAARTRATLTRTLRAMATDVTLTVVGPTRGADAALDRAVDVIRDVERTCSRFDPASALSAANAAPGEWHDVPDRLVDVLGEALQAHRETGGLFDPRVHDTLVRWGYDRSLPFQDGDVERSSTIGAPLTPTVPWAPHLVRGVGVPRVNLGGARVDLGGIGKGLAVRWAAAKLATAGAGAMVDGGGDIAVHGSSPGGGPWLLGVEDPCGGADPVLVIAVNEAGCATSSRRLRRWRVDGEPVHHLVDPRTGRPGGAGLLAVTVVAPDAAWSEVWSKSLFLAGADRVRSMAEQRTLAAAWIGDDGEVGTTSAMDSLVRWRRRGPGRAERGAQTGTQTGTRTGTGTAGPSWTTTEVS